MMDHTDTSWPRPCVEARRKAVEKFSSSRCASISSDETGAWPAAKAAKEAKEAANQIKAKEAVKKDKRWNPFAEIWV